MCVAIPPDKILRRFWQFKRHVKEVMWAADHSQAY
jgi:hypothetical protein